MSSAGFYHSPTNAKPLLTRCYLCKVEVEEWEEGDSPIEKHLVASRLVELPNQPEGSECALAVVKSQSWETDGARLGDTWDWGESGVNWPRGERMENARKGTFAVGWPVMEEGVPSIDEVSLIRPPLVRVAGLTCTSTITRSRIEQCLLIAPSLFGGNRLQQQDGTSDQVRQKTITINVYVRVVHEQ